MEPPNSGHVGTRNFVLYGEVVLSSEVKKVLYSTIGKWNFGTLKCVLYREFFFYCVLYSECPLSEVPLYTQNLCTEREGLGTRLEGN